jgi:hypothetical protein
VFNEFALVDLGDQGIRLCVIMPLADFGFFRSTGPDAAHPERIRPNALVPDEVRKSFEWQFESGQLFLPWAKANTTLAGTCLLAVAFILDSAWMVTRSPAGLPAPDDEYVVQIYLVLPSRQWG